jgi:tryptophan 6-halogenase
VTPAPAITILGGGTAGWMAACLFADAWPAARITVIESPEIGIVGVGEGSTPQLAALLDRLGIAEAAWMPRAHATYKAGIAFRGWSERPGHERYFHPFAGDIDRHTEPAFHANALARRGGRDVPAHPDRFFLNSALARAARAPLPAESFPFRIGYGFHFDAHLVGAVLRDHAVARGVTHLQRRVVEVAVGANGDVAALVLEGGERIAGDLFVDASGFRGAIAQEALQVPFLPFGRNLFNDRAVTIATPPSLDGPAVHTTATALSHGWVWDIPLTTRTGNGYVYASGYCTPDAAETELRAHLGLLDADAPARHLAMKVGRVERSWAANCLAIGLAQGFLEPLEATALHIVQATVEGFIRAWGEGGFTPARRDAFNADVARRYEGVRDYIVCHYRLNRRTDTSYWRDNAANDHLSDDLKAIITAWFTGGDLRATVEERRLAGYYAPMSWGCLFAGYGAFPDDARLRSAPDRVDTPAVERFLARCLVNFPDHRDALAALAA